MYTKTVAFKDFKGHPRNMEVNFNLTEMEVFDLFIQFKTIQAWQDSVGAGVERVLTPEEVAEFYSNFKEIMLSAYGAPSDDGLYFRKSGRYDFEESALYNATMLMFFTDPSGELVKFMQQALPQGMEELIRKVDENALKAINETSDEGLKAELVRLRAQVAAQEKPPVA